MIILVALFFLALPLTVNAQAKTSDSIRETTQADQIMEKHSNQQQQDKQAWNDKLKFHLHRSASNLEEYMDVAWTKFGKHLGLNQPRTIVAYRGYSNNKHIWVSGRVLANRPYGSPLEDDGWWDNLQASYSRWESDEITDAKVQLTYRGTTQTVTTDSEGYYRAKFARSKRSDGLDNVVAEYESEPDKDGHTRQVSATHRIYGPNKQTRLVIISDMDDTVIHTGITDLLVAAQLTFLNNAKTRKPLTGVGALYQALSQGPQVDQYNPTIYVSNSAWNMYDLLRDFLELNNIPEGPLLLRDIGLTHPGEGSSEHKPNSIAKLIEQLAPLPVVLVGDSGQHDAEIYAQLAVKYPTRIQAIYIRDVDPEDDSEFDRKVDDILKTTASTEVPFMRVRDSHAIATHAEKLGLLSAAHVDQIATATKLDKRRDTLAEEASDIALDKITQGGFEESSL